MLPPSCRRARDPGGGRRRERPVLVPASQVKGVAADISHVNTKASAAVGARGGGRCNAAGHGRRGARARTLKCVRCRQQRPCRPRPAFPRGDPRAPRRPPRRPQGFEGPDSLADALKGCDLVIIPAGVPRKPGMTRDDLFKARGDGGGGAGRACVCVCE
jgi:hypothetical protein